MIVSTLINRATSFKGYDIFLFLVIAKYEIQHVSPAFILGDIDAYLISNIYKTYKLLTKIYIDKKKKKAKHFALTFDTHVNYNYWTLQWSILAKRPLILARLSARTFRDSYLMCLSYLFVLSN